MIDEAYFEACTGITAPVNFQGLLRLAKAMFQELNLNNMSEECEIIYSDAICWQIAFVLENNSNTNTFITRINLGDASETYAKKEFMSDTISPLALSTLKNSNCNFYYAGLSRVTSCGCK